MEWLHVLELQPPASSCGHPAWAQGAAGLPVLTWLLSDCAPTVNPQPGAGAGHAPTPAKLFCILGSGMKALQDLQWGMGRMQCPGQVSQLAGCFATLPSPQIEFLLYLSSLVCAERGWLYVISLSFLGVQFPALSCNFPSTVLNSSRFLLIVFLQFLLPINLSYFL